MSRTRNTKIVATIGPQSLQNGVLEKLHYSGMDIARLNGSHNTIDWHRAAIENIRERLPFVPILIDLPGKKIRTLETSLDLQIGTRFLLTNEVAASQNLPKVATNFSNLNNFVAAGMHFYADDGTLKFKVLSSDSNGVLCESLVEGKLKSKKGLNFPQSSMKIPIVRERDIALLEIINSATVDFVGISFVESALEVQSIKNHLTNSITKCVSKIETQPGIDNLEKIIESSDFLMIDRGDLSVETSLSMITMNQKHILEVANKFHCPVIVATEMLNSMIENPHPTKAEISDITNAVLDGAAAVMLSGETAVGKFPLECITIMQDVIQSTETTWRKNVLKNFMKRNIGIKVDTIYETLISMLAKIGNEGGVSKIILVTKHGFAAKKLSTMGVAANIIAVSDNIESVRYLNSLNGISGYYSGTKFPKTGIEHFIAILKELMDKNIISVNDIVAIAGITYPKIKTKLNTVAIFRMSDID